jgi:hypothetical protein
MLDLYAAMYGLTALTVAACLAIQLHSSRPAGAITDSAQSLAPCDTGDCDLRDAAFSHCQSADHVLHCRVLYVSEIVRSVTCAM